MVHPKINSPTTSHRPETLDSETLALVVDTGNPRRLAAAILATQAEPSSGHPGQSSQ